MDVLVVSAADKPERRAMQRDAADNDLGSWA
jgi:hypothetical protein